MKINKYYYLIAAVLVIAGLGIFAIYSNNQESTSPAIKADQQTVEKITEKPVKGDATQDSTERQLLYLIEEEKLAHDVYTKMYELYGARVFGNILNSESTHQASVLVLLNARDIKDPRSDEVGIFKDQELQALYNELITKGEKSAQDAYEVGVIIEEKDIKDISDQLETAKDADVITTLEALRRGSENHLRAFNRQL